MWLYSVHCSIQENKGREKNSWNRGKGELLLGRGKLRKTKGEGIVLR
jgi:hypothetical protein